MNKLQTEPALLLDVDGALCPFGVSWPPDGYDLVEIDLGFRPIKVWIGERNSGRLQKLAEHFEIVWASSWEERANQHLLTHHGLSEPLEVIAFDHAWENAGGSKVIGASRRMAGVQADPGVETWKLPWIRAWADHHARAVAWIDDDIHADAINWAAEREIPALTIATDPAIGLTDDHVEALVAWTREIHD